MPDGLNIEIHQYHTLLLTSMLRASVAHGNALQGSPAVVAMSTGFGLYCVLPTLKQVMSPGPGAERHLRNLSEAHEGLSYNKRVRRMEKGMESHGKNMRRQPEPVPPLGLEDVCADIWDEVHSLEMLEALAGRRNKKGKPAGVLAAAATPAEVFGTGTGVRGAARAAVMVAARHRKPGQFKAALAEVLAGAGSGARSRAMLLGALMGARVGVRGLPQDWLERVDNHAALVELAEQVADTAPDKPFLSVEEAKMWRFMREGEEEYY